MTNPVVKLDDIDRTTIDISPDEIIAVACVRNESLRLPYFLDYHRSLGVHRFLIVDNDSTDGTMEFLGKQHDVHVFLTRDSYSESRCGVDWLNLVLNRFGVGHWTLTLEADVLFTYPRYEQVNLRQLVRFLDDTDAQGLVTFLMDMYSNRAIKETVYPKGAPFLEYCGYFDSDTYHEIGENGLPMRGGPRHRLFWQGHGREKPSPFLQNTPLVKWRQGLAFEAATHIIGGLRLSRLTGALQHFKFFSDFYTYVEQEAKRKEHWDGAAQYESYWCQLKSNPDLSAWYPGSVLFEDSQQLIGLGLMKSSDEFDHFVADLPAG